MDDILEKIPELNHNFKFQNVYFKITENYRLEIYPNFFRTENYYTFEELVIEIKKKINIIKSYNCLLNYVLKFPKDLTQIIQDYHNFDYTCDCKQDGLKIILNPVFIKDLSNIITSYLDDCLFCDKLKLDKFDLSKIKRYSNVLLIGKRQTGKTTIVRDILRNLPNIHTALVFSPGPNSYPEVPSDFIFDQYNPDTIQKIIERQKELKKKDVKSNICIVLDDAMHNYTNFINISTKDLIFNGRHHGLTSIITLQYPILPHIYTSSIDYIFLFNPELRYRKTLYEKYGSSFRDFNETMNEICRDHRTLVIDNIKNKLFWYENGDLSM